MSSPADEGASYRAAGVDVAEGRRAVERMAAAVTSTHGPEVIGGFGSFAGLFALGQGTYTDPVLVCGSDGVGTKVEIARAAGIWNTVGIDLVAMCVNDILCHGAAPKLFLDYIAVDTLNADHVADLVEGVAEGCRQSGCTLLGGETAEMPGVYRPGRFDMAGFAMGVAERDQLITGERLAPGQVLVGFASSGVHSNGFSLVRHLFPELEESSADPTIQALQRRFLQPTRIYHALLQRVRQRVSVAGIAHVTGGGWDENIPRMAGGQHDKLVIAPERSAVPVPALFQDIAGRGVAEDEMYRTFNMGVGLVVAVAPEDVATVVAVAGEEDIPAWPMGEVLPR